MKLHLAPEFLVDLREIDDSNFIKRVIGQILDDQGSFRKGQNDHRYHGIQDAWIRYISRGKTAYRLIFIQKNDTVHLYRVGQHNVEDNLGKPQSLENFVLIASPEVIEEKRMSYGPCDEGTLLKTSQTVLLRKIITGLTHIGHKEIFLISPFVSEAVLDKFSPFGRFLDKMVEDNAEISLVTLPPAEDKLLFFQSIEARGINVYFFKNLHAKLYLFEIQHESLNQYTRDVSNTAILGSANLTEMGLALEGKLSNEELCYTLPQNKFDEAKDYATWLVLQSEDFITYKSKAFRRF